MIKISTGIRLEKAFYRIQLEYKIQLLYDRHIPRNLIKAIKNTYQGNTIKDRINGELAQKIEVNTHINCTLHLVIHLNVSTKFVCIVYSLPNDLKFVLKNWTFFSEIVNNSHSLIFIPFIFLKSGHLWNLVPTLSL